MKNSFNYSDTGAYPLRTLFWESTLRCNARCEFCGSRCGECHSFPDELTTEEIRRALSETAAVLDPKEIMLNITGGEPLVRSDVLDVAGYASALGFPWGMVTNGSLITPEVISRMRDSGMKTITVSIDGCKATHEELRKLYGSFDRIISSLRQICKEGFCDHVQVTTVVNRKNIDELESLRDILADIGLDSWRVVTADPIGRAKDNAGILPDKACMDRYFEFLEKYGADPTLPVISSCSHYFGDREHRLRSSVFECGAGKRVASILYNGDIFVCPNVERRKSLIQGNVRKDPLPEVWQNGFAFFRNRERTLSDRCRKCYYKDRCLGDSLHTFDFDTSSQRFCILDFYGDAQAGLHDKKTSLYRSVLDSERRISHEKGLSPTMVRISYDKPSESRVVFTGKAADELFELYSWGETNAKNTVEQLACLFGKREDSLYIVSHVRESVLEYADETSAVFTQLSLDSALKAHELLRSTDPDAEILGFIHSHPSELKMTLSTADAELHLDLMEKTGLALSMLINPQKKQLRAYYGQDFDLSEIIIL